MVIVLSASRPVPGKLIAELDEMIDRGISNDLTVKFNIVQQGSVDDLEDAIGNDGEKSEPVINE